MASTRVGSLAEPSTGGFSYAQAAAKRRSPSAPSTKTSHSGVSGTATPSTMSASDLTPGSSWADDTESKGSTSAPSESTKSSQATSTPSTSTSLADVATGSPDAVKGQSEESYHKEEDVSKTGVSVDSDQDGTGRRTDSTANASDAPESAGTQETEESSPKDTVPVKPIYQEAKPPAVNIWQQRAAEAKGKSGSQEPSKPTSSQATAMPASTENERIRSDPRRRSEAPPPKRTEVGPRARDDGRANVPRRGTQADFAPFGAQRRTPPKARERATSEITPPPVTNEVSWPKPTDVRDDSKKKPQEKDQKSSSTPAAGKPHGKTEWKAMPYTPTAVFETAVAGRGSGRMGRGNTGPQSVGRTGRGGLPTSDNQRPNARASSLPNGEAMPAEKADLTRTDREAMPPPFLPKTGRSTSETAFNESKSTDAPQRAAILPPTEQTSSISMSKAAEAKTFVPADANDRQTIPPRRNQSLRKSENPKRAGLENDAHRSSIAASTEDSQQMPSSVQADAIPHKSTFADRRAESQSLDAGREPYPFREGKRGGRKGGRGGFGSGHYPSPGQYSNGFNDMHGAYGMPPLSPFHSQRGGHFQQGRNGYRNNPRSHSIPHDAYGRPSGAFAGIPTMGPASPFMPLYDGSYPAGPYMMPPASETDFLFTGVLQQIEYYFSLDNIIKDMHLRRHMDGQGWIFLSVIAQFNRLKNMTQDYDLIKAACLQSNEVEIRVGHDSLDRLRKREGWEQFVVAEKDRDQSVQNPGPDPSTLRRPSVSRNRSYEQPTFFPQSSPSAGPQGRFSGSDFHMANGGPPPFVPGGADPRFADFTPAEETRGRQTKTPQHHHDTVSPLTNGHSAPNGDAGSEPDTFPSSQIDGLTVVVRKHEVARSEVPFHNSSARTFSNGSLDARNIVDEVQRTEPTSPGSQINGTDGTNGDGLQSPVSTGSSSGNTSPQKSSAVTLFWVKDQEAPVDVTSLPADTTHELYTQLRLKALAQRDVAATGTCPYDLDVLYQFWSHFLIRNFNSSMYSEFRHLATSDASHRHNSTGVDNLIKYYSESLASTLPIRDRIAHDFVDLVASQNAKGDRSAYKHLKAAWGDGALNIKNRKKVSELLDDGIKAELDA